MRIELEHLEAPGCDPLPLRGVQGDRVGVDGLGARFDLPDEVAVPDAGACRGGDSVESLCQAVVERDGGSKGEGLNNL